MRSVTSITASSANVLEKCGFHCEGVLRKYAEFPNLSPGEPQDVCATRWWSDMSKSFGRVANRM